MVQHEPLKVLFIEDNIVDVQLIREMLLRSTTVQIHLEHASTISNGIARVAKGDVDAVLLDLNLATSTGLDTLSFLKAVGFAIPVIVLTGLEDEALGREAVRRGAQDYLIKGDVDTQLLVRAIIYARERVQAEQRWREDETRLRLLTHQVPAILWTTDRQLRFTSSVGRGLDVLGLDQHQVEGQTLFEYFQTTDNQFLPIAMHVQALEGKESSSVVDWARRLFQVHVEPLRDRDGQIIGTVGVALDITDQQRMDHGMKVAQRIQRHLLPTKAPQLEGFDIGGDCFPANHCSGDYFDFIRLPQGRLAIAVADAVGHGFGPAILAATVRSYLRAAAMQQRDAHEMLTMVNWLLFGDSEPDQYVTVFCCHLDPRSRTFTYASAGHQAYLIDARGKVKILDTGCIPLGIHDKETFQASPRIALRPGDILFFMTDGIPETESPAGELFGIRRSLEVVKTHRQQSARDIVQSVYDAVCQFAQPRNLDDDVTAVVVKVGPYRAESGLPAADKSATVPDQNLKKK